MVWIHRVRQGFTLETLESHEIAHMTLVAWFGCVSIYVYVPFARPSDESCQLEKQEINLAADQ